MEPYYKLVHETNKRICASNMDNLTGIHRREYRTGLFVVHSVVHGAMVVEDGEVIVTGSPNECHMWALELSKEV